MKYPPETRPKYLIKAAHYRPLHGNSIQPANPWGNGDSGVWGVGFGRHLGRRKGQKTPILQKKEVLYPLRPRGYRTFDLVDILVDRDGRRRSKVNNGWAGYARKVQPLSTPRTFDSGFVPCYYIPIPIKTIKTKRKKKRCERAAGYEYIDHSRRDLRAGG